MYAVIINPADRTALARGIWFIRFIPLWVSELLFLWRTAPKLLGTITGLKSKSTGESAEGLVVGIWLTPRMIRIAYKTNQEAWLIQKIVEAVTVAVKNGATHIALTGQVGGGKLAQAAISACLKVYPELVMTSGNGLTVAETVAVVRQEMARLTLNPQSTTVGVVGCYGSIGQPVATLLATEEPGVGRFVLLGGKNRAQTERLANQIRRYGSQASVGANVSCLRDCDVVIVATSTSHPFIFAEHLKPGAIVVDIAVPPGVDRSVINDDRFEVIAGGVVVPPARDGIVASSFDFGLDPGHYFACMAEIMLGRLDPSCREAMTTQSSIGLGDVRTLAAAAKSHGFTYVARRRK